jgi:glycosyltransferase involved in cell wall biosynthesis
MAMRKIAFVNQHEGGGATAVCRALESAVRAEGHAVWSAPSADVPDAEALLKGLRAFGPDVIHAHCFYNAYGPEVAAEMAEIAPLVFTVHDTYPVNSFTEACWTCDHNAWCWACPDVPVWKRPVSTYRVVERRRRESAWKALVGVHGKFGAGRVTIVWPSAWMKERCAKTALAELPDVVAPYGVDLERYRPRLGARAFIGEGSGLLVVAAANMYAPGDRRKGIHVLLEAWTDLVRPTFPDARLNVLGSVHGHTAPEGVRFLGSIDPEHVPLHFAAADLSVLPTLGDNCPMSVLESLASGCPVVATRVGGIPEVVDEGETGWLAAPDDVESLSAALIDALARDSERRRRALRARMVAESRFGFDAWMALHRRLYGI